MDKKTETQVGTVIRTTLIVALVILPMAYVASVGPVVRMVDDERIDMKWVPVLAKIYAPLEWSAEKVPVIGPALKTYVRWWSPIKPIPVGNPAQPR